MPHPNETPAEREARWRHMAEADDAARLYVNAMDLRPEWVDVSPVLGHQGRARVNLAGSRVDVGLQGDIAELRAVLQEADKQLARLEVEHRIDVAVEGGPRLEVSDRVDVTVEAGPEGGEG